jgi:hypothetical protein
MQTELLYYVLREGSTREEQWSWDDVESLCRSGDLTPQARIYLPDEQRWAAVAETRLAETCQALSDAPVDEEAEAERAEMETAYQDAVERAAGNEDPLEALLDAGALAAQLGLRDEARAHLQSVLHRYPYHARAAQEVRRRFNVAEQRSFRYLDRPAPAWEDIGAVASMPLARGPLYFLVPAAVVAGLMFVPFGGFAVAALCVLWAFQTMEYTARGANRPPEWNRALKDPVRKLVRPAAMIGAVVAQWAVIVGAAGYGAMVAGGHRDESLFAFLAESPVFVVVMWIVGVLYLPAAVVSVGGFTGSAAKTLDPRRLVRMVVRMEHEYVYTMVLLGILAALFALLRTFTGGIAVAENAITGMALAYAVPMAGLLLGRLLGRSGHVIE